MLKVMVHTMRHMRVSTPLTWRSLIVSIGSLKDYSLMQTNGHAHIQSANHLVLIRCWTLIIRVST
jgi:hypothetical protein